MSSYLFTFDVFKSRIIFHVCGFQGTVRYVSIPSGDEEIRTLDPLLARQVLSQLSYIPGGSLFDCLVLINQWA